MPGEKLFTVDGSNFYLHNPLKMYVQLKSAGILKYVIEEYQLKEKVTKDGFIHMEIQKVIYGLPQSGILAQES